MSNNPLITDTSFCAYDHWIKTHYGTKDKCINRCNEAVSAMTSYFNSLTVQVGRANGIYHCWCIDENKRIVDPTIKQFDGEIKYTLIAARFLNKDEIELATGALFLDT